MNYRFSVWTATYNRGHLLHNVYECLVNQTFKDFEWIIIDDGSTDETKKYLKKLIKEQKININYIYKENILF